MLRRLFISKGREEIEAGVRRSRETWFSRMASLFRSPQLDEAVWEEVEEILLSADVGVGPTEDLIRRARERAREDRRTSGPQVLDILKVEMGAILREAAPVEALDSDGESCPLVMLVVGVNGTGKTTSIAKLAHRFQQDGKKVILGAADTFRAAATEQLQVWGQRLGVEVVAHQPGSDPGAVAFDALQAARARGADVLIIDTAGRLHTKANLMEELKKVHRVLRRLDEAAPHQVLLVLDATTGQNGLSQACHFTEAVGCSGVFLAKLDGTAKGGIVLAIARELKLPVLFIGTGEGLEDMALFDPEAFVEALFADEPRGVAPQAHAAG